MKFLLCAVNAKYIHSNPAVYSLRAYAGEEWFPHIEIAEYTINQYADEILADLYRRKPDVLAFSCYIWNWELIQRLLEEVPKILPGVPVWLGGPEVSFSAEEILGRFPVLTGIMIGEGEETFRELLEYYGKRYRNMPDGAAIEAKEGDAAGQTAAEELSRIAGLCLRSGYTAVRELTDLNTLPFLYDNLEEFENRIIYYESSRGCPYRCSYCLSSIDKKVRLRDQALVERELQIFIDRKVPQVKFVDRTFNCSHEHAMAIWRYLAEHDNGVTNFHFEISADLLREEEIELLGTLRPGLVQLEIGVQSANPRTLQAINRHADLKQLEEKVAQIRAGRNIHQHLDLIAGLPFEDYESFGRSFDRVYGMRPDQLQLGFLKVLKGSPMEEQAEQYGICYQSRPPYEVLYTDWISYEEVLRLKQIEEMVELYYNSNQFTHTLPFLEQNFSSAFGMYEELAQFFAARGMEHPGPARVRRYELLLEFAREKDPEYADVYRELLTFDLYLRENAKSRPEFAPELLPYKEQIRSFYQEEETRRCFLPAYEAYDHKQLARMTRLEPFRYPVWDEMQMKELRNLKELRRQQEPGGQCEPDRLRQLPGAREELAGAAVLFDYQDRSPLTGAARVQRVSLRKESQEGACPGIMTER